MEAIKLLEPYLLQLKAFFAYAKYCGESDIHAPVCRDFLDRNRGRRVFHRIAAAQLVIGKRVVGEQL